MNLTTLPRNRQRFGGRPDPAEVITITIGGRTFLAGRRTAAHLQVTFAAFGRALPHLRLEVAQACYNAGYEPSQGTHDGDAVPDFYVTRADGSPATEDDYWAAQWLLRCLGWAIWFRHTGTWAARSSWHLHGISLGCPGPVGEFVPGQVDDYHRRSYGLKGQHNSGADPSRFPKDIDATYFDYPAWLARQEQENDMTPDQDERLKAVEKGLRALLADSDDDDRKLDAIADSVLAGRRADKKRADQQRVRDLVQTRELIAQGKSDDEILASLEKLEARP